MPQYTGCSIKQMKVIVPNETPYIQYFYCEIRASDNPNGHLGRIFQVIETDILNGSIPFILHYILL